MPIVQNQTQAQSQTQGQNQSLNQSGGLPDTPTNVIFTGVAGTGKTHRLLELQKRYDATIVVDDATWREEQVASHTWRDIICAVLLLEDRLMSVPELIQHPLMQHKIATTQNSNINETLWVQLNHHAHPNSATVNTTKRSANYYFDKTENSQWYLLDDIKEEVRVSLAELLTLYRAPDARRTVDTLSRSCLVSFHQAYGYDEFVEGIRPSVNEKTGQLHYGITDGAFLTLCKKAMADPNHRYAMLIDEMNRGNTAQIFGELMSLIEPNKRAGGTSPMHVQLAYSKRQFSVPSNVDIYATMNTQDHAITSLDMAFRRRFEFVTCEPDATLLNEVADDQGKVLSLAKMMRAINERIGEQLGGEARLGHAYFMGIDGIDALAYRLYRQILPQIIEQARRYVAPSLVAQTVWHIVYGKQNTQGLSALFQVEKDTLTFNQAFVEVANKQVNASAVSEDASTFRTALPYRAIYRPDG